MLTFYYHPTSSDYNGNYGPDFSTPGWVKVFAKDRAGAVIQLSPSAQTHIASCIARYYNGQQMPIQQLMEDSAGWGIGFTLVCEQWGETQDLI